jgi:hypothetical protein
MADKPTRITTDLVRDGKMESVFIDKAPFGFAKFAPVEVARGTLFSARRRMGRAGEPVVPPAVTEEVLYRP